MLGVFNFLGEGGLGEGKARSIEPKAYMFRFWGYWFLTLSNLYLVRPDAGYPKSPIPYTLNPKPYTLNRERNGFKKLRLLLC